MGALPLSVCAEFRLIWPPFAHHDFFARERSRLPSSRWGLGSAWAAHEYGVPRPQLAAVGHAAAALNLPHNLIMGLPTSSCILKLVTCVNNTHLNAVIYCQVSILQAQS